MTPRPLTDKHGNLDIKPRYDDQQRLRLILERLRNAYIALPGVRDSLDDRIADAVDAQGQGGGSGISDTVARAAAAIVGLQNQHRALTKALHSIEDSVEHFSLESERALGRLTAIERDGPTHLRCPKMVLLRQTLYTDSGKAITEETLVRCDKLTAHKVDEGNNPIDYDRDGYCDEHRAEANEAMRRAQIEQGRRLRRKGAA